MKRHCSRGNIRDDNQLLFKPFAKLPLPIIRRTSQTDPALTHREDIEVSDQQQEAEIFRNAMVDVKPITRDKEKIVITQRKCPPLLVKKDESKEVMEKLKRLVETGEGFIVSLTPEYIEGTGKNVHAEYARRLHMGEFSIKSHIDLHGLTVNRAKEAFDNFMRSVIKRGEFGVLIIHGRGLSSPGEPILKRKVVEWLTSGPWKKWVFAFASARSCDGGAGATYVLLKRHL
ncbi:MAG: Smr/MutS family protein [Syntrophales bacterium]|nr:Smr/MutS family protein [Syntrophales bacterium]